VRHDVGRLGMWLLLAALAMLFAGSVVGTLVVRSRAAAWPPPGTPDVTAGLWLSTALLALSSATLAWALAGIRRGDAARLRRGLAATLLLGVGFLASQALNWARLATAGLDATGHLYGFTFYLLTALHAAHVLGGVAPLAVTTARAAAGRYSVSSHAGVTYVAMYWHFLDAVWLLLFALLLAV
jgi:cytochrome c oxidase subunit III